VITIVQAIADFAKRVVHLLVDNFDRLQSPRKQLVLDGERLAQVEVLTVDYVSRSKPEGVTNSAWSMDMPPLRFVSSRALQQCQAQAPNDERSHLLNAMMPRSMLTCSGGESVK
jgi:hypothetical protein